MHHKIITLVLLIICTITYADNHSLDDIAKRIAPVGKVKVEKTTSTPTKTEKIKSEADSSVDISNGEKIYSTSCKLCHEAGLAGAPKLTEADWQERAKQGFPILVKHAIEGFKAMPAKGGCANCSDEDIKSAVEYMLKQANVKL